MAFKVCSCTCIFLCSAFSLAASCESNPKDAIFVSTALGRLTSHFFKNCSKIMLQMNPYPAADLVNKFVRSTCVGIGICERLISGATFKEQVPCIQQWLWARWLCGAAFAPSARVVRHLMAYLLKVTG
ncbi:uncharacterized protein [Dermacentor andersoni]|uniref:uncharacterized protein isoform X2 n=1 Tax=Dermacentor andersoni TaxID=34620 RepID=UPI002416A641|nr:uncharacterized protein LOC129386004 isoform X2 [Dermacentor andersoni]